MQIFVENAAGRHALPAENGKHNMMLYNNRLLIALGEKETVWIEHNGRENYFSETGEYSIPIEWDKSNKSTVIVKQSNVIYKYHFLLENTVLPKEEDIINLLKFVSQMEDNFYIDKDYPLRELFSAIKDDRVSLIIEKTPYSGYDDQSLLRKISETVPMVMDICSHPKQSLRTEEAILDVNLVKRINSRTMDHLASHSEHWKSRSLNGLIPNRLRADIFEDEINIYENLFFRMAVDDVLKYVHRQVVSIEKTIQQNDNAIDWSAYGVALADYKRMRVFQQLLPDYDVKERQQKNQTFRDLLVQWLKLEKNFSTVEASQFYRSIDKKKHISRNIRPTNILKKDSRYNALYRLWCEIQRQIVQEQEESFNIQSSEIISIANSYAMYVAVLIVYVFKLIECEIDDCSTFRLTSDGLVLIDAVFKSDAIKYIVKTEKNCYGTLEINITFRENIKHEYPIPEKILDYLGLLRECLPEHAELDVDSEKIIFYSKPTLDEQKSFKKALRLRTAEKNKLDDDEKRKINEADTIWREGLEKFFAVGNFLDENEESIKIIPQYAEIENSENSVEKFTRVTLDSAEDYTIFTLPIDIGMYRKNIKSPKLICRLLNYGEKYFDEDAKKWGDYRVGIIPASQTEINSAQRLMKLISIHASRLQIKWNSEKAICPVCGSKNCSEESSNNWKCNNTDCGIIFGLTKHADGCGENYEWTRPFIDISKSDINSNDYMNLMLRKEIIFDRLAITDFEFTDKADGTVKYVPICPRCGKRSFNY